jgi:hypothetical protein
MVEVCWHYLLSMKSLHNPDRYNTFFALYPLGISSEMWLVYKAVGPAAKRDARLPYVLYGILGLYVPGRFCLSSAQCVFPPRRC